MLQSFGHYLYYSNMETKAFFGKEGLTSTSANYIANIAKEFYTNIEQRLNNIRLYTESVTILGSATDNILTKGWTSEHFTKIEDYLEAIKEAKSLIAFLREALKEKERLAKDARTYENKEEREKVIIPVKEAYLTEEDIIKTWTIGEQEKYLSLETECAVIGKFIHEDGAFNKARKTLETKISNPCVLTQGTCNTILHKYTPSISQEDVDNLFFKLQAQHREKQAELNGLKHKIEVALKEDMLKKDDAYQTALNNAHAKAKEIEAAESIHRMELLQEVESLRIVIPNNLKNIYDTISHLAK